ncbi:MAG: AMP-binding protein [Acidobacteriaceae bacterium]|nr:AMP-binding protein [Acidobacteriaceae bacterium]
MDFWRLSHSSKQVAAIDSRSGRHWTYGKLAEDSARVQSALPKLGRKTLGLLVTRNCYESLVAYLAALNAGCALILLDANLNSSLLERFLAVYRPDWIFGVQEQLRFPGYRRFTGDHHPLFISEEIQDIEVHRDVALLLSTSGSTGSPKLVRLTLRNIAANAASISEYLQLNPQERPITSLPLSYSYGLSVVNSHLHAGAAIVFSEDGALRREFWEAVDRYGVTSFAGVPYTYQLLLQAGLLSKRGDSLRTLTQAGGRLEERFIKELYRLAIARGWKFFVMYGQTEATARISYVPFDQLGSKIGSVGIAVPGGSLRLDEDTAELIYSGPNVMLGYAECRSDLAKGDELHGILHTGDLARRDDDGYLYIVGRKKRFLKLFGRRFNLDDVEGILSREFESTIACYGRDDLLTIAVENCLRPELISEAVCKMFDLPRVAVRVVNMEKLPITINGKLDYQRLAYCL